MDKIVLNRDFLENALLANKYITEKQLQACGFHSETIDSVVSESNEEITTAYYNLLHAATYYKAMICDQKEIRK